MKQRVISSCVALVILFVVLAFFDTLVFNAAIALIVAVALFELLHAEGCLKDRFLTAVCCLYGASVPFIHFGSALRVFPVVTFCYIAVLFSVLLRRHRDISALQIGFVFFVSILIPLSLTVSVYMRDQFGTPTALFYILMALGAGWLSDTGAFFVGRAFGRHKLAPVISPKKTVEGAIGGVVSATVFCLCMAALYQWAAGRFFGVVCEISYPLLAAVLPVLSVLGMLGDLSASVIKRQTHIKDYGNIMPGHGGVVDRFDSVFFTAPTLFFFVQFFTLFRVV